MIARQQLEDWLRGLPPDERDRAILALGVDFADLGAAQANASIGLRQRVLRWSLTDAQFSHRQTAAPGSFAALLPRIAGLRIAVESSAAPTEILPRLLRVEDTGSAFTAIDRPAGALRRRPWGWPLRVGLVGFSDAAADAVAAELGQRFGYLSKLVELRRIEDEPAAVDLAVLEGPLVDAVAELVRLRPIANAIVVLDAPLEPSPLVEAQLATARLATSAAASALVPPTDLAGLVGELVDELSHAQPFDVALTAASKRKALLWAEPAAMAQAGLPEIALGRARELGQIRLAHATPPAELGTVQDQLLTAAAGPFAAEGHEATQIAELSEAIEPALDALGEQRWCQARVGEDNTIRHGRNPVSFFIGPLEEGALAAPDKLDESALPWEEESADAFRLTILFVPAVADATAQQAELELPRFGRSADVTFELDADEATGHAAARILVLFRNRILQTAVLGGRVGAEAQLTEVVALVPTLTALDDRRPFDVALMANHTNGQAGLTRHSNGETRISSAGGVPAITARIANVLAGIAMDDRSIKKGLLSPAAREILVELAVEGRDFLNELEEELGGMADAARIQLVSARSSWFLPLELAYSREAPDDDATICANFLADPETCDGACTPPDDTSSLCPGAFWGLSKTIERHRFDPEVDAELGQGHVLTSLEQPRPGKRDLTIERTLVGASGRIADGDRAATIKALGAGASAAANWKGWETSLKAHDTQLLVLLPHTDYNDNTLEIADSKLKRGRIEARYVTGTRDVAPVVMLFGCRTTGTSIDPAGFATRFMQKGASAVFHSSTDLKNSHATELARRLAGQLAKRGGRPRMLSDVLTEFRREAVHDGMVVVFAIAAFGDADWRI